MRTQLLQTHPAPRDWSGPFFHYYSGTYLCALPFCCLQSCEIHLERRVDWTRADSGEEAPSPSGGSHPSEPQAESQWASLWGFPGQRTRNVESGVPKHTSEDTRDSGGLFVTPRGTGSQQGPWWFRRTWFYTLCHMTVYTLVVSFTACRCWRINSYNMQVQALSLI